MNTACRSEVDLSYGTVADLSAGSMAEIPLSGPRLSERSVDPAIGALWNAEPIPLG